MKRMKGMKNVFAALVAGMLGVAGGTFGHGAENQAPGKQPLLMAVGTNRVEIGDIYDCVVTNVPFRVANTGKVEVALTRLVPMCSCITAAASAPVIPAGGEVTVDVALDSRKVKGGVLERGLWVCGDDTELPYLKLELTGRVVPLFAGVPASPVALNLQETGKAYTNRIRLSSAMPGVSLGAAQVSTNGADMAVAVDVTPVPGEGVAYDVTVVATASAPGSGQFTVQLPVSGKVNVEPLLLNFKSMVGSRLVSVPKQIVLELSDKPQVFRVILRGDNAAKLDPGKLSWDPLGEGVSVSVVAGRDEHEVLVKVEVTSDAAEALYLAKKADALVLKYPDGAPVKVPFVFGGGEAERGTLRGGRNLPIRRPLRQIVPRSRRGVE